MIICQMSTEPVSELEATGLDQLAAMRAAIAAHNLVQFEIADRVGVSEGHLSLILKGRKRLSDDLAKRIRTVITEMVA